MTVEAGFTNNKSKKKQSNKLATTQQKIAMYIFSI